MGLKDKIPIARLQTKGGPGGLYLSGTSLDGETRYLLYPENDYAQGFDKWWKLYAVKETKPGKRQLKKIRHEENQREQRARARELDRALDDITWE